MMLSIPRTQESVETGKDRGRLINLLAAYGIREPILSAFGKIPRERFVPQAYKAAAYEDLALPIGEGQTISQPSLVALMLQELGLKGNEKVLDVGTGSGFQAALLGALVKKVYTIERIEKLTKRAKAAIKSLKIKNVEVLTGDGSLGIPQYSPYDAIIVAAAFREVPKSLVKQLRENSRLIMPVGPRDSQEVVLYKKRKGKLIKVRQISPVRFVPLVGRLGWKEQ